MKRIPLTQGKYALVDDTDFERLNQFAWHYDRNGYAAKKSPEKVYMHRFINETPAGFETDHINRNRLDNRRCNLRSVNRSQNCLNTSVRIDNRTGHKGVCFDNTRRRWLATFQGKYLGRFASFDEAVAARNRAERVTA